MLTRRILCVALAALFLSAIFIQQTEAKKIKKLIAAHVLIKALKPRFIPLPIPIPFKLKINKGDKVVPYPVHSNSYSHEFHYGGGDFGYGGGGGFGGGGGYGEGGGYGGGGEWW